MSGEVKSKVKLRLNVFWGQRKFQLMSSAWVEEADEDEGDDDGA